MTQIDVHITNDTRIERGKKGLLFIHTGDRYDGVHNKVSVIRTTQYQLICYLVRIFDSTPLED